MHRFILQDLGQREVNNFNELGHDTEIVSNSMDFAVISMYSDNLLIFYFALNPASLRVKKKSISQRNALNSALLILENKTYRPALSRLLSFVQAIACLNLF